MVVHQIHRKNQHHLHESMKVTKLLKPHSKVLVYFISIQPDK